MGNKIKKEAIILAGGLGTRLRSVVKDVPKPMADINGKPFLEYLLDFLNFYKFEKIVLAVGYKREIIQDYFKNKFKNIEIDYSIEEKLLGTGGAITKALKKTKSNNVFIFNGDTFLEIDVNDFLRFHLEKNADISIALKHMKNFDRYGSINIDKDFRITSFEEKSFKKEGYINGGVYIVSRDFLENLNLDKKFSFEKDVLEKFYKEKRFFGYPSEGYFIDIGIPKDYLKAQKDLKKWL